MTSDIRADDFGKPTVPGAARRTRCCVSLRHDVEKRTVGDRIAERALDRGRRRPVIVVKGVANPACPATGPGPFLLQSGCDRARHHRPARRVPTCRAGRPPRSAAPEHRHRRGDRAARRRRRPSHAPGGCAFPAAAPEPTCSRSRLRAAVLKRLMPEPGRQGTPVRYCILVLQGSPFS
jgi:hypothetical protein